MMNMAKSYAVVQCRDGRIEILSQSEGFDLEKVTEKVTLSDRNELWVCSEEKEILREAQNEIFRSLSRDVRTPMNAILGMSSIARKHIDEKSRVIDCLERIDAAGEHLLELINEVLELSDLSRESFVLNRETFSLSDLLHEMHNKSRPDAAAKKQEYRFSAGEIQREYLIGDPERILQILL